MGIEREFLPEKRFMLRALELAREAGLAGEVPVGAVIVRGGSIIAQGRNRREEQKSALAHAEIEALAGACKALESWRLEGCQLYVTLEPCPMCAGAVENARIERVIYAADSPGAGTLGVPVYRGFMEEEAREVLREFFRELRCAVQPTSPCEAAEFRKAKLLGI
ncbi:nucleoside deaminase [Acutalibacter muris]|uniref:tRNA-specific adenosine deaminase n=1 Tax=Acutalibacter muris TaxID=1796620 RepID=A0A1Z2XN49_9FIRM|nr:nucleoside deaminase [Acutalibacter muris]ANU53456.1 tRNA-specific adenosine deaminase [Hungateiclostridiaceae bacterium KB18]ASB39868.1 tRNA-specific adenosine deaminase [Acutalibacter muris]QQR29157.1 nucleoside deaminase [Acutalibacter muris]